MTCPIYRILSGIEDRTRSICSAWLWFVCWPSCNKSNWKYMITTLHYQQYTITINRLVCIHFQEIYFTIINKNKTPYCLKWDFYFKHIHTHSHPQIWKIFFFRGKAFTICLKQKNKYIWQLFSGTSFYSHGINHFRT